MTLQEFLDIVRKTSLEHKDVSDDKGFSYGESFDLMLSGRDNYPHVFLELPYSITYEDGDQFKTVDFALNVFLYTNPDSIEDDHIGISKAEQIGDAILAKLQAEYKTSFRLSGITALSLREFTDDDLAGMRFEATARFYRAYCDNNYEDQFNSI